MITLLTRRTFVMSGFAASFAPALAQAPRRLTIVGTTGMIADAARIVGAREVAVRTLMGPGVDPHAYRQTRSDIAAMSSADLVLWHGLYLEAQLEKFLLELAKRRKVIPVGEAVPVASRLAHDEYKDRFDPHVWMNPALWQHVVAGVRDALIAARPVISAKSKHWAPMPSACWPRSHRSGGC
jgi:manganese/zinc/iron transport system substrate-binding protein